jgi:hypothetical protein
MLLGFDLCNLSVMFQKKPEKAGAAKPSFFFSMVFIKI